MINYPLFLVLAFVSEIIGTVSGFGSSLLFVPIASLFFDFKTVLGITAVFHVFSNITKIVLFRKGIDKNIALKLGIPAIIFVSIGAYLTVYMPERFMTLFMNLALLSLSVYLMVNFHKTLKQTETNLYLGGALSGFLAGVAGTGGAIRGLTLAAFQLPKDIFIATSALIDLGVDASRAIVYVGNGYFEQQFFFLIPFLIGISILGSYIGKKLLEHTSEILFRYIVLVLIIVTAGFQFVSYLLK